MKFMKLWDAICEARKTQKPNSDGYNALVRKARECDDDLVFVPTDDGLKVLSEAKRGGLVFRKCLSLEPHYLHEEEFAVLSEDAPKFRSEE